MKHCTLHHTYTGTMLLLPGSHNICTLFRGLFQQSFYYHMASNVLTSAMTVLKFDSAIMYYNIDVQLFFLSTYILHKEHSNHGRHGSQGHDSHAVLNTGRLQMAILHFDVYILHITFCLRFFKWWKRQGTKTKQKEQIKQNPKQTKTRNCSTFVLHCTRRHGRWKEQSNWLINTTAHQ